MNSVMPVLSLTAWTPEQNSSTLEDLWGSPEGLYYTLYYRLCTTASVLQTLYYTLYTTDSAVQITDYRLCRQG